MTKKYFGFWLEKFFELTDGYLGKDKINELLDKYGADSTQVIQEISKAVPEDKQSELSFKLTLHLAERINDDELVQSTDAGDGTCITPMSELVAKAASGETVYYTSYAMRTGLGVALSEIEHNMFPPKDAVNDKFEYYTAMFPPEEKGVPITIFGVPKEYDEQVKKILASNSLICKEGVSMATAKDGDLVQFKVTGPGIYVLENVSGSKVYTNQGAVAKEDQSRADAEMKFRTMERLAKKDSLPSQ